MKFTTVLSIIAVLAAATPALAATPIQRTCSAVGEIAYSAAVSRDAGEPLEDAVREFNHGFNKGFNEKLGRRSTPASRDYSLQWRRFYDWLIHEVYAESSSTAQQVRDEAYGGCVEELTKRAANDPDRDVAPPDAPQPDAQDADQAL